VIITHNVVSCCIGVVVKLGDGFVVFKLGDEFVLGGEFEVLKLGDEFVFVELSIQLSFHFSNIGLYDVIELIRSICRDMTVMVWHDMIDVLGVGMLDNRSSGISSTNIR